MNTTEDLYERPGKIENIDLAQLNSQNEYELIPNVWEAYDYVVVDINVWDHFKRWYGYDVEIVLENEKESIETDD